VGLLLLQPTDALSKHSSPDVEHRAQTDEPETRVDDEQRKHLGLLADVVLVVLKERKTVSVNMSSNVLLQRTYCTACKL
jgi:hypothetical protein